MTTLAGGTGVEDKFLGSAGPHCQAVSSVFAGRLNRPSVCSTHVETGLVSDHDSTPFPKAKDIFLQFADRVDDLAAVDGDFLVRRKYDKSGKIPATSINSVLGFVPSLSGYLLEEFSSLAWAAPQFDRETSTVTLSTVSKIATPTIHALRRSPLTEWQLYGAENLHLQANFQLGDQKQIAMHNGFEIRI
ncbi:hypothetical protein MKZ38_009570 [Zalerion maritima]|uniref:Uncharacterized protein n=1 Tax=Zalerion maritima TaxID=339359 RepID=A0AAD5RU19_9PEZI|nr:hypothetical protein MKZ38_009570 [Zalerion maritima]